MWKWSSVKGGIDLATYVALKLVKRLTHYAIEAAGNVASFLHFTFLGEDPLTKIENFRKRRKSI